jgi:hypothetical protein
MCDIYTNRSVEQMMSDRSINDCFNKAAITKPDQTVMDRAIKEVAKLAKDNFVDGKFTKSFWIGAYYITITITKDDIE